jgi:hypothetical protein
MPIDTGVLTLSRAMHSTSAIRRHHASVTLTVHWQPAAPHTIIVGRAWRLPALMRRRLLLTVSGMNDSDGLRQMASDATDQRMTVAVHCAHCVVMQFTITANNVDAVMWQLGQARWHCTGPGTLEEDNKMAAAMMSLMAASVGGSLLSVMIVVT